MSTSTPRTTASRRSILRAVAAVMLATVGATAPTATLAQISACLNIGGVSICNDATGPITPIQATAQLRSGNYQGFWHDGRPMVERVRVTPNEITVYRVAGGDVEGTTARYIRSGPNSYNSTTGHIITVTGPHQFTWTNSSGRNGVSYNLMQ